VAALVASGVVAVVLLADGRWVEGALAGAASVYFGLRASGVLGGRGGGS
jgi:hypothetical protein